MITVIGGINIDIKAAPFSPLKRGTSNPGSISVHPGGVARNIAQVIALLGGKVVLAGIVGDDDWGRSITDGASRAGVDTSRVKIRGGAKTDTYAAVLTETGELDTGVSSMERINEVDAVYIESINDLIERSGFVVLDANLKRTAIEQIMNLAGDSGTAVIAEPVSVAKSEKFRDLPRPVDFITPNLDELAAIAGSNGFAVKDADADLRDICASLSDTFRHILVTMGACGVYYYDKKARDGEGRRYPAYEARIKDATGAGDSFTGGFTYGLDAGLLPEESIRIGMACAVSTLQSAESVSGEISGLAVRAFLNTRRRLP